MALTILIDRITSAIDKGEPMMGIYLNFAEEFDKVNPAILLRKLSRYKISGPVLQWFQSSLSGRKQTVRIGETNFVLNNTTSGVPQ